MKPTAVTGIHQLPNIETLKYGAQSCEELFYRTDIEYTKRKLALQILEALVRDRMMTFEVLEAHGLVTVRAKLLASKKVKAVKDVD